MKDVLSRRALNRAALARQHLLARERRQVLDVVEHLVGMQAQIPHNPYVGLWARLEGFRPDDLVRLLINREVVRTTVMRGTLHLVSARDCLLLRPLMQPVLDAELSRHRDFAPPLRGVDVEPALAFARSLFEDHPRTGPALRAAFAERFPGHDAAALAYACRCLLALVQVPPRGIWGRSSQVTLTTAQAWLGRPLEHAPSIDEVVLRYFAAFGPATVADAAAWSRLSGMREVIERLQPRLREFTDERGRELFDVPEAPRPDPDTPAPPRFLPEYDNVLLAHADRSRFVSTGCDDSPFTAARIVRGSVLDDGFFLGTWHVERGGGRRPDDLVVQQLRPLTAQASAAVEEEGRELLRLLHTGPDGRSEGDPGDVRLVAAAGHTATASHTNVQEVDG